MPYSWANDPANQFEQAIKREGGIRSWGAPPASSPPAAWRRTSRGALRMRVGAANVAVWRDDRGRWHLQVELLARAADEGEACRLAEAVAASWAEAHAAGVPAAAGGCEPHGRNFPPSHRPPPAQV